MNFLFQVCVLVPIPATLLRAEGFVDGKWQASASGKRFDIEDTGTGEIFTSCADFDTSDIDDIVQSSAKAFKVFGKENPRSRARKLLKWDRLIRQNKDNLALLLTYESGKPLAEAHRELDYALSFT
ncbi:Aldedh domain-containing protein [Fusarium sp. LHS14.1]|nr:Aldedh domain-containing protein [Fusarium sp. LHS14.1]